MKGIKQLKNLSLIFAALAIIASAAAYFSVKAEKNAALITKSQMKAADKIVFETAASTFTLTKRDGQWKLSAPFEYAANSAKTESLLKKMSTSEITAKLTKKKENYSLFGLDSPLKIVIYEKDKLLSSLSIGKEGPFNKSFFFLKKGSPWVLQAEGMYKYSFPETFQDLVYKKVFRPLNEISEITVKYGKTSFKLEKKGDAWHVGRTPISKAAAEKTVIPLINSISSFEAEKVRKAESPVKKPKDRFEMKIKYAKDQTLLFKAAREKKEGTYYATVSDRPGVLLEIEPWKLNPFKKTEKDFIR